MESNSTNEQVVQPVRRRGARKSQKALPPQAAQEAPPPRPPPMQGEQDDLEWDDGGGGDPVGAGTPFTDGAVDDYLTDDIREAMNMQVDPHNMEGVVLNLARDSGLLLEEVGKAIIGKEDVLLKVFTSILSDGHILFEDFPGLAKTLMANSFADALGCRFKRVQFTPDLLPSDITGTKVYDERRGEFYFERGPIFTNILLADEINRAPPKTQAALLEAMQERQVTVAGVTYKLPRPFVVLATQNPIEYEGTYPLPEAQLDRFRVKQSIGYPSLDHEDEILKRRIERQKDDVDIKRVMSPASIIRMQRIVENVFVEDSLRRYIVALVQKTRSDNRVLVGSSPRGSLSLLKLARAAAVLNNRAYIIPDDIKVSAMGCLSHRLILKPEYQIKGLTNEEVINDILESTPLDMVEKYVD